MSGTPTSAGSFSFTVTATDSSGVGVGGPFSGSQAYSGTIAKGSQTITFGALGNRAYGSAAFTVSASASSSLSVNFSSQTVTVCTVSGNTVTLIKTGTCTIRASQGGDGNWTAAADIDQSFTVTAPVITMSPAGVPSGTVGSAYTAQTLSASGGTAPYTFALTTGTVPAGLTLSSAGVLSGTPTTAGGFSFTVTATDSSSAGSGGPFAGTRAYSLNVAKATTSTTLTANLEPTAPSQTVVLTASVSGSGSGASLSGTVDFMDVSATLCGAVALSGAQAQCTTSTLAAGSHTLTAVYSGNNNFLGSTSPALTHTVGSGGATLTVNKSGSGTGTVSSNPPGIDCGIDCAETYAGATVVTMTATPAAGSIFTGWLGACIGTGTCTLTMSASKSVAAVFAPNMTVLNFDIDGNRKFDALSDGLMILRSLFGLTGNALTAGAIGAGATVTNPALIQQQFANIGPLLDVDGNGQTDALTDGLIIIRYMFGLRGPALINGAIGTGATRTGAQIEAYIQSLLL